MTEYEVCYYSDLHARWEFAARFLDRADADRKADELLQRFAI